MLIPGVPVLPSRAPDGAERLLGAGHHGLDRVEVADVGLHGNGLAAGGVDLVPRYMTAIRLETCRTTPRSWETNTVEPSCRFWHRAGKIDRQRQINSLHPAERSVGGTAKG